MYSVIRGPAGEMNTVLEGTGSAEMIEVVNFEMLVSLVSASILLSTTMEIPEYLTQHLTIP